MTTSSPGTRRDGEPSEHDPAGAEGVPPGDENPAGALGPTAEDGTIGASRGTAVGLVATGVLALLAAFALTIEKIKVLQDPSYVPTCSINPVLSCGSVMKTWQASAFGFPNMTMGLAGYAVVVTLGAALLAGARLRRWFWAGTQVGVTFGVGFIHWLIFMSLYDIGALCPYCMVAWAATIPMFVLVTLHNLRTGVIPVPHAARRMVSGLMELPWTITITWYLVIVMLVLTRFWSYWRTLL